MQPRNTPHAAAEPGTQTQNKCWRPALTRTALACARCAMGVPTRQALELAPVTTATRRPRQRQRTNTVEARATTTRQQPSTGKQKKRKASTELSKQQPPATRTNTIEKYLRKPPPQAATPATAVHDNSTTRRTHAQAGYRRPHRNKAQRSPPKGNRKHQDGPPAIRDIHE